MRSYQTFNLKLLLSLILLMFSLASFAEAFCALRDPLTGIYKLYPQATSYRSIVRTIDQGTREMVRTNLPPNTLHFGELGRHTLYIALQDDKPIGMVHVRSEESKWGLVEVAWAINLDMSVHDFTFQRARSSARHLLEQDSFRRPLIGQNFGSLKKMLVDGTHANPKILSIPKGAEALSSVLLRSGLKTLLLTRLAWKTDLDEINLLHQAKLSFSDAHRLIFSKNIFTVNIINALRKEFGNASTGLDRDSVVTAKVADKKGRILGAIYLSKASIDGDQQFLYWSIDRNLRLVNVTNLSPWPDVNSEQSFKKLTGKSFNHQEDCNNQQELMALEAMITVSQLLE